MLFTFAHVVPQKGVGETHVAADCMVDDIRALGYSHLAVKSGKEPAIRKLRDEALKSIKVRSGTPCPGRSREQP